MVPVHWRNAMQDFIAPVFFVPWSSLVSLVPPSFPSSQFPVPSSQFPGPPGPPSSLVTLVTLVPWSP